MTKSDPRRAVHAGTSPFVIPPGEGLAIWHLDTLLQLKAPAAATAGRLSVWEHTLPHHSSPPLHVHHREDEAWYVLEGRVTYRVGEQLVKAEAGSFVWAPKDLPHSFRVDSPSARVLALCVPGGFDEFFVVSGRPAGGLRVPPAPQSPPDMQEMIGHGLAYGCEVLGPPMTPDGKGKASDETTTGISLSS